MLKFLIMAAHYRETLDWCIILTLYSTQAPLDAFEMYDFFKNIIKNGTFALEEQVFHFP